MDRSVHASESTLVVERGRRGAAAELRRVLRRWDDEGAGDSVAYVR